jgi:hypothetical protein
MPKDTDNHLCDALRYAFEDVKFFKPQKRSLQEERGEINFADLNGGWDI